MKNQKKKLKTAKGITLIALVITIIVLLILAGVTISALSGDNGIFEKVNEAKENTNIANEKEQISLAVLASIIKENNDTDNNNLQEIINAQLGENEAIVNNDGYTVIVQFKSGRYYSIENDGTILGPIEKIIDSTPGILSGEGKKANPYLIESVEDFIFFLQKISNGYTYKDEYVEMTCGLDFGSILSYSDYTSKTLGDINKDEKIDTIFNELTTGNGITISGINSNFYGNFNGKNYSIANIQIYNLITSVGIIPSNYGTIKNLNIKSGYVYGKTYVGGIVGTNYGTVENCKNNAGITAMAIENISNSGLNVGGIAGYNIGNIINSGNTGKINATYDTTAIQSGTNVGGIIGYNNGDISHCYNLADLEAYSGVGGIVGKNASESTISYCYNSGNILAQNTFAGGIVGFFYKGEYNYLNNSYNKGKIVATKNVGGIAGTILSGKVSYKNNYYLEESCIGAIDSQDYKEYNTMSTINNLNSLQEFIEWLNI